MLAGGVLVAAPASSLELSSADLPQGSPIAPQFIYRGYGCAGGNLSPALEWRGAPVETQSFALLVRDPDAPGGGFWHWIVIDLPPTSHGLDQGAGRADGKALPSPAQQLSSDFGAAGWGGPCPPAGDHPHHYVFTLYALDVARLSPPPNASAARVVALIESHTLAVASLTRLYGR